MENIKISQKMRNLLLRNHAAYLKDLQSLNQVQIRINDDNILTIRGSLAHRTMKMIECNENNFGHALSHFISFPLNLDCKTISNYNDFTRRAMKLVPPMVIYEGIKLHFTLCVMTLLNPSIDIELVSKIIDKHFTKPLVVTIKDLATFETKGTMDSTSLIYAKCENINELNELGKRILNDLAESCLVTINGNIKWHMTVMNTLNSRDSPNKFNATDLMESLGNWNFGTIEIKQIHLSKFGTFKKGSGKFYEADYIKQLSFDDEM